MLQVPKCFEKIGLVLSMFGFGFFFFSILAWRGFYLVERTSIIPWMQYQRAETLSSIYWWNYVVLALTLISLVIGLIGFIGYVYAEDPEPQWGKSGVFWENTDYKHNSRVKKMMNFVSIKLTCVKTRCINLKTGNTLEVTNKLYLPYSIRKKVIP